jgi:Zn-dependent protease
MFLYLFEQNPAGAVAFLLGVLVGIVVHEASHASSAYVLGDDTAYREGRVTLNPPDDPDGGFRLGKADPDHAFEA